MIRGGPGSERLDGEFGRDRIFGGGGDDELGSEDSRAELHGGDGDDFLIRLGPESDCGTGIDTFAAPDGVLRLGRVRAGCELASPDLEDQLATADPSIVVDSAARAATVSRSRSSPTRRSRAASTSSCSSAAGGWRSSRTFGCAAAPAG